MTSLGVPNDNDLSNSFATIPDVSVDSISNRVLSREVSAYAGSALSLIRIAKTVTGTFTMTSTSVSAGYGVATLDHNLNYVPSVFGSFTTTRDTLKRQIPYTYRADASYFGTATTQSASVDIYSIDTSQIIIRIYIFDAVGLSWVASNTTFNFKFLCYQEPIAS